MNNVSFTVCTRSDSCRIARQLNCAHLHCIADGHCCSCRQEWPTLFGNQWWICGLRSVLMFNQQDEHKWITQGIVLICSSFSSSHLLSMQKFEQTCWHNGFWETFQSHWNRSTLQPNFQKSTYHGNNIIEQKILKCKLNVMFSYT